MPQPLWSLRGCCRPSSIARRSVTPSGAVAARCRISLLPWDLLSTLRQGSQLKHTRYWTNMAANDYMQPLGRSRGAVRATRRLP